MHSTVLRLNAQVTQISLRDSSHLVTAGYRLRQVSAFVHPSATKKSASAKVQAQWQYLGPFIILMEEDQRSLLGHVTRSFCHASVSCLCVESWCCGLGRGSDRSYSGCGNQRLSISTQLNLVQVQ